MSEEQPEGQDPPGEDEAGEGEAGEGEAGEGEAPEAQAPEAEVAASGAEEGGNEAEATTGEEAADADAQEAQEQEAAGSDEPSPVEYTEIEVQTDFTFSPSASNTDIARQLLETLEAEDGTEEPAEGEEGAEKEAAEGEGGEGEGGEGEGGEGEGGEEVESELQEETEIDDWIKETKGKKPKESRAMWDYSLYAPISMVQEQIVETYEDLVLPMITKLCQPMWDYDLLASVSMIESQVDESYELKLELTSLRCEPMWDYDLSVPPEVAQAQVFVEEKELKYEISSLKCYPMWDYDLNAPIQKVPEEIYWVPSYLNFVGVTRQKFFHIEETPNTKFIQTDLHFDPETIIQPEDLLKEPNEEEEEKRRCYTDPNYVPEEISDIIDDDGAEYPSYFDLQKPYKIVGDHCVTEEEEEEEGEGGEEEESESARAERGSESEEPDEEVTSTEVQTDVGLGELLQSESISSVPEPADEAEEQEAVGDTEESAPAAEGAEGDETSKGEPDVPWALLSDSAVAPQQFLVTTEDDILSTVSLAPTAERQEYKFNFAITLGGSVWGFPEYSTEEEPGSGTVLPQNGEEFTWVPDSTTPFESSVFTPISEEDALLLESVHADEPLEPAETEETDEVTLISEDRELTTSSGPVIEVEITMPSAFGENFSENVPQIEVGVAWEALPESLADGRTPDIIVKTVVEEPKK